MIALYKEKPYKLVCKNCGFSKIIVPKRRDHSSVWAAKRLYKEIKDSAEESISDADSKEKEVINLDKNLDCCPKCSGELERATLNAVDKCVAVIQDKFQDVQYYIEDYQFRKDCDKFKKR